MICLQCNNDNPRSALECITCGTKLSVVRCKCSYLNSLMDQFCGGCGKQLIKATALKRMQKFETHINTIPHFTEQELMTIIEIQQQMTQAEHPENKVTQNDIDQLFG